MTAPAILRLENLTKKYRDSTVVDAISFTVAPGQIVGLLGPNGAGKTTTLAMLLGLLEPDGGNITALGETWPAGRLRALRQMNYASPYIHLPARLTVREILTLYGHLYTIANLRERIAELAAELALNDFLERRFGQLSAGQQTRVSLAKALINHPRLLLLDEPTASMDPDTADWVRRHFRTWRDRTGASIILASHNMREVEMLCDTILMMKTGRIVDSGTPASLIARHGRADLEQVFLAIARDTPNTTEHAA